MFWVSARFEVELGGIAFPGYGCQMTNTDDVQVEIVRCTADEDWTHYMHALKKNWIWKKIRVATYKNLENLESDCCCNINT